MVFLSIKLSQKFLSQQMPVVIEMYPAVACMRVVTKTY